MGCPPCYPLHRAVKGREGNRWARDRWASGSFRATPACCCHARLPPDAGDAEGRSGRGRDPVPQTAAPGWLHPPPLPWDLRLSPPDVAGTAQGGPGGAGGNGPERGPGNPPAPAATCRALAAQRPLGRLHRWGGDHVPPGGSAGPGAGARPHPRGGDHHPGGGSAALLPPATGESLSDPDQIPR